MQKGYKFIWNTMAIIGPIVILYKIYTYNGIYEYYIKIANMDEKELVLIEKSIFKRDRIYNMKLFDNKWKYQIKTSNGKTKWIELPYEVHFTEEYAKSIWDQ